MFLLFFLRFTNCHIQSHSGIGFFLTRYIDGDALSPNMRQMVSKEENLFCIRMETDCFSKCMRNLLPLKSVSWALLHENRTPSYWRPTETIIVRNNSILFSHIFDIKLLTVST